MENNQNIYRIDPAIAIAVILQLIFVIFAGVTIHNILNCKTGVPKIKISNYSAIPSGEVIGSNRGMSTTQNINFNLDDVDKRTIEGAIYNIVSLNNDGSIANYGAKIRENSAHYAYIEGLDIYFLNFIVDLDDLRQSYRFTWRWSNNLSDQGIPESMSIMTLCLREDEMIYGDFSCKDGYDGRGIDMVVYDLIRYRLFSNFSVGLSDIYDGEPLTLSINVSSNSESARIAAIEEVSNYLADLGFNLNEFKYSTDFIEVAK